MITMKRLTFILSLATTTLFVACEDSGITEGEVQGIDLITEITTESAMEDLDVISDAGFDFQGSSFGRGFFRDEILDCAIVENDTTNNIITIDYGDGCEGKRGRIRKGKVIVEYSGEKSQEGSFRRVTLEDFFIDSTQIEGIRTMTVTSVNEEENTIAVDISLVGGKVTFNDGTFATRASDKTRTRFNIGDDESFSTLEGTASGVNKDGLSYDMQITEALVFKRSCWGGRVFVPVDGMKIYTVDGATTTIDYGDGTCDNLAVTTQDGVSEEIELTIRGRKFRN